MAKAFEVRPIQEGDIEYIAGNLRLADQQELIASRGQDGSFFQIVAEAVGVSTKAWAMVGEDLRPTAVFGVAPVSLLHRAGSPWLLGTDALFGHARTLVVWGRWYVARMREMYPGGLHNYVDARNVLSVNWLKRIGFTIHPPEPYGVEGQPFHLFTMTKDD